MFGLLTVGGRLLLSDEGSLCEWEVFLVSTLTASVQHPQSGFKRAVQSSLSTNLAGVACDLMTHHTLWFLAL